MNFYPIYRNKKLLPWVKYWLIKGNKVTPKVISDWIEGTTPITITGAYKGSTLNPLELEGNTSQTGTPTPDNPIPVQVVKGDNYININGNSYRVDFGGKNLFDIEACVVGITLNDGTFSSAVTSWRTSDFIKIDLDTKYNFSWQPVVTGTYWQTRVIYYDTSKQWVSGTDLTSYPSNYNITITTPSSGVAYMKLSFTNTGNHERTDIQLEKRKYSNFLQSLCI